MTESRFGEYSFRYKDLWLKLYLPRKWAIHVIQTDHPCFNGIMEYFIHEGWINDLHGYKNKIRIEEHLDRRYLRELNRCLNNKSTNLNNRKFQRSLQLFDENEL